MSAAALLLVAAGGLAPATLLDSPEAFEKELAALHEDGATVVLHFWAIWCPACVDEFPKLAPALKKALEGGAKVALFSLDPPEARDLQVPRFLAKYDVPGRSYLLDADPEPVVKVVDPSWPLGDLPATFVFREGKLVKAFHGQADPKALLEALR